MPLLLRIGDARHCHCVALARDACRHCCERKRADSHSCWVVQLDKLELAVCGWLEACRGAPLGQSWARSTGIRVSPQLLCQSRRENWTGTAHPADVCMHRRSCLNWPQYAALPFRAQARAANATVVPLAPLEAPRCFERPCSRAQGHASPTHHPPVVRTPGQPLVVMPDPAGRAHGPGVARSRLREAAAALRLLLQ